MSLLARLQSYFEAVAARSDQTAPLIEPLGPADPALFASAALPTLGRSPVLACAAADLVPPVVPPGLTFVILDSAAPVADIQVGLDANALGFDPEAPLATVAEAEAFRAELEQGRALTALLDGVPAGAGMVTAPHAGIAELMGITTLEAYRGRGIAAAITAELARIAFGLGVDTAILSTDNPIAYRVYRRIGFRPVVTQRPRQGA